MKRYQWLVLLILITITAFVLGGYMSLHSQHSVSGFSCTSTVAKISVSGIASKDVVPDRATIRVSVVGESKDADEAMNIMKENALHVMEVALRYTDAKYIKTTDISLKQRGHWDENKYIYDKFLASETVVIDVEKDEVGDLVGELTSGRAEHVRISDISFYYADIEQVRKQLLEKAILDAKDNAERLVRALGAQFLSLKSVSYVAKIPPQKKYLLYGVKGEALRQDNIPISAGIQKISVSVSAVFEAGPVCSVIETKR